MHVIMGIHKWNFPFLDVIRQDIATVSTNILYTKWARNWACKWARNWAVSEPVTEP